MMTTDISDNLLLIDLLMTAIDQNRDDSSVDLYPIAALSAKVLHDLFSHCKEAYTDEEVALIERARDYLVQFTEEMVEKEKNKDA